jgi:hypothetical protein
MARLRGEQFTEQRFWSKVRRTNACWEWEGHRNPAGYGVFSVGQKLILAHRFRWELSNAAIASEQRILHKCDNPACVRIDHLFLGTQADNVADMSAKGRDRKAAGESHGRSKLTDAQVQQIRDLLNKGDLNGVEIGQIFGVSKSVVSLVRNGKRGGRPSIIETGKVLD